MIEKYMTASCFEKLQREMNQTGDVNKVFGIKEPVYQKISCNRSIPRKNNKSDRFTAIIKVDTKN
jgi:hypothetical protein